MAGNADLAASVRHAWSLVPAPPATDMEMMDWGWGADAARTFTGVRPIDVDIDSVGFLSATPLLDLPAQAAAAYLGPYLLSLLQGLEVQENVGFPTDISTRAHTLTALTSPGIWTDIAGPYLPPQCQAVLAETATHLIAQRKPLILSDHDVARLERLVRSIQRTLGP